MILEVKNIHVDLDRVHVLRGISLDVGKEEIVMLLGRNGAGKTTTMKSIMGIVPVRSGKIIFEGKDLLKLSEKELRHLMGWKTAEMVDVYVELMPEDLKRAYLRTLGFEIKEVEQMQEVKQKPIKCPRCGFINLPGSKYCSNCGCPLTTEAQVEIIKSREEEKKELIKLIRELYRKLKEGKIEWKELIDLLQQS